MTETSVDELEVVRYYLKCEIGKVAMEWKQTDEFVRALDLAIDSLDEREAYPLALALSGNYRRNGLSSRLGKTALWRLQRVPCYELLLPLINDKVNSTLEDCNFNLARFSQRLKTIQFNNSIRQFNDPNLFEFRDDNRKIPHTNIICEHSPNGKTRILDGSHRAVILALRGNNEISCFIIYER